MTADEPMTPDRPRPSELGQAVEVQTSPARWEPGVIVQVWPIGRFDVRTSDGSTWRQVHRSKVRAPQIARSSNTPPVVEDRAGAAGMVAPPTAVPGRSTSTTGRLVRESRDGGSVIVETTTSASPWPGTYKLKLLATQGGGVGQVALYYTADEATALRDVLTASLGEIAAASAVRTPSDGNPNTCSHGYRLENALCPMVDCEASAPVAPSVAEVLKSAQAELLANSTHVGPAGGEL